MTSTNIRRLFWGLTIFVAGLVLLLQSVELLPGFAWKFIWPTFIVIIGIELMITSVYQYGEEVEVSISKNWFKKAKKRRK
jgi:hypothetical protein